MPGEKLLAGLWVAAELERRVLLVQAPERLGDLVLVALRLRRDREAHHRLREVELRHLHLALGVGEQVAGLDVLQLRDGTDVAVHERVDLLVVLPLQQHQPAEPLLGVVAEVDERRVGRHRAAVDAEDVDLPGERVGDRLEDEGGGAAGGVDVVRLPDRRGHSLDDQVEQCVRPEVLRRDAAGDRIELVGRHRALQRRSHGHGVE